MIILNLAYPEKISEVEFKVSKFPDGQQTIDLLEWSSIGKYTDPVMIKSRLNSFRDLELIICATQAVRNIQPNKEIQLYVPYFLGSRSDRKFVEGGVNYLKQVICPIINSQNYSKVITVDSHSDVLEACLNNYEKISNVKLAKWALSNIDNKDGGICLISPDAGAYKKVFDVAKILGIEKVVTASKVRDVKTGQILRTEIPNLPIDNNLTYLIIDDIGDGFGTFIQLAKEIKSINLNCKINLIVTHSIQESGIKNALNYIDKIYTTNSYNNWEIENLYTYNVF
jgi:ribose-phosphate pyrophosphokinase